MELLTGELRKRLSDRRIELQMSAAARTFIARQAHDPVFGARPLKRFLQHELETRIGRALIAGEIADGDAVRIDLEDGELTVHHESPAAAGGESGAS